ncbi:hypothetical protein AB0L40_21005, partial [Patulibacter sp. NPDC049589]|uniref:hypothetical protein n=1 Tax=Patulibacter sp. NPDC049589 TaxID=3154731 RepID=UPI00343FB430
MRGQAREDGSGGEGVRDRRRRTGGAVRIDAGRNTESVASRRAARPAHPLGRTFHIEAIALIHEDEGAIEEAID